MRLTLLVFALMGLVACNQSSHSEEQFTVNNVIPKDQVDKPTVPTPEKIPFTATISVPSQIKSNEEFVVEATLKNLSDKDLTILHASRVFYFKITDKYGKGVNTFVMDDVGIFRPFRGQGRITEQYVYKLETPGYYEVSAIARFSVGEGDNKKDFELETSKASFKVLPLN
ncbi:hypothetical protein ACFQI7_13150 [Paenibacillus allorhizosphaerae]|uniref:YtkA-like domain-containing protein n=1 Tax=Paenibacillus allorhizosphaerae TaxID=2849866 RepID=A0ABM8VUF4_9BACL|nr:hypothetical protein [Paenibacillus allorhizosphaerae]CAG7658482.1 hypothetical protein PAECIP111802_07052 [Paenibacillus allorhizosphaerae]